MGSHDLWARNRKAVCDAARFPWSCVNYICSRKTLEIAFLDLFISKFSGGGHASDPSPPQLAAWYPRLLISYPRQLEILVTALIQYQLTGDPTTGSHSVRRAQSYILRAASSSTVVWPGKYVELDVPPDLGEDCVLALQPRSDAPMPKNTSCFWPEPQILEAVGTKIRLVNTSDEPKAIGRHEHLSQVLHTASVPLPAPILASTNPTLPVQPKSSGPFSSTVSVDPDNSLPEDTRLQFQQLLLKYDSVFDPDISSGYNGAAGPIQATVNIGPVQPPQRKGRVPQYSRNQLSELQAKFEELEQAKVFRRPEDIGITVEYLNPSFLVKKPSGSH